MLGDEQPKRSERKKRQMKSKRLEISQANLIAAIESWITPFKGIPRNYKITDIDWKRDHLVLNLAEEQEEMANLRFYE